LSVQASDGVHGRVALEPRSVASYDIVRRSESPDDAVLAFLQTTYAAAADLAGWDRRALERARDPRDAA
jgi:hypothetical protein